jgi:hypothetical protein
MAEWRSPRMPPARRILAARAALPGLATPEHGAARLRRAVHRAGVRRAARRTDACCAPPGRWRRGRAAEVSRDHLRRWRPWPAPPPAPRSAGRGRHRPPASAARWPRCCPEPFDLTRTRDHALAGPVTPADRGRWRCAVAGDRRAGRAVAAGAGGAGARRGAGGIGPDLAGQAASRRWTMRRFWAAPTWPRRWPQGRLVRAARGCWRCPLPADDGRALPARPGRAAGAAAGCRRARADRAGRGGEDGRGAAPALADRLGLFLDLDGVWPRTSACHLARCRRLVRGAALRLPRVRCGAGGAGARRPRHGHRVAARAGCWRWPARGRRPRCAARRRGGSGTGASWCWPPRHNPPRIAPSPTTSPRRRPKPPPDPPKPKADTPQEFPAEMLVEAARAALPPDLLERLAAGRSRAAAGSGRAHGAKASNRRGRPLPARGAGPAAPRGSIWWPPCAGRRAWQAPAPPRLVRPAGG